MSDALDHGDLVNVTSASNDDLTALDNGASPPSFQQQAQSQPHGNDDDASLLAVAAAAGAIRSRRGSTLVLPPSPSLQGAPSDYVAADDHELLPLDGDEDKQDDMVDVLDDALEATLASGSGSGSGAATPSKHVVGPAGELNNNSTDVHPTSTTPLRHHLLSPAGGAAGAVSVSSPPDSLNDSHLGMGPSPVPHEHDHPLLSESVSDMLLSSVVAATAPVLASGDAVPLQPPSYHQKIVASLAEDHFDTSETEAVARQSEHSQTILDDLLEQQQQSEQETPTMTAATKVDATPSTSGDLTGSSSLASNDAIAAAPTKQEDQPKEEDLNKEDEEGEQLAIVMTNVVPAPDAGSTDKDLPLPPAPVELSTSTSTANDDDEPEEETVPPTATVDDIVDKILEALPSSDPQQPQQQPHQGEKQQQQQQQGNEPWTKEDELAFVKALWPPSQSNGPTGTSAPTTPLSAAATPQTADLGQKRLEEANNKKGSGVPASIIPPTAFSAIPSVDVVSELLARYYGANAGGVKRTMLNDTDVEQSEEGLLRLMATNSWKSVASLSAKLLLQRSNSTGGGGETGSIDRNLQVFMCRIHSLVKLRLFETATAELEAFGDMDRDDLFWADQPASFASRRATHVPFSLRLMHAELPGHLEDRTASLDRLHTLLLHVRGIQTALTEDAQLAGRIGDGPAAVALWRAREAAVLTQIVNQLYFLKDYAACLMVMEALVGANPDVLVYQSQLGRLYLQLGNTQAAAYAFQRYDKRIAMFKAQQQATAAATTVTVLPIDESRANIDKGFLHMATGNYNEAVLKFEEAHALAPIDVEATNNLAVAHLYLGRLRQAIAVLEEAVRQDPLHALHETIIFNLCTLYELESDAALDKKKALILTVAKYHGDHLDAAVFKGL